MIRFILRIKRNSRVFWAALFALAAVTSACTSKSGVSVSGITGAVSANFTLTAVNTIPKSSFTFINSPPHPAGTVAIFNSDALRIQGNCDRGVAFLLFAGTGVPANTVYTCSLGGAADFTYTVGADGEYDFTITPYGADGNPSGTSTPATLSVFAKSTAPAPVVLSSVTAGGFGSGTFLFPVPASGKVVFSGGSSGTLTFVGTYTGNIGATPDFLASPPVSETTSGLGGTMSTNVPGAGQWTYVANITQGQNVTFTFLVKDSGGNASSAVAFAMITNDELLPPQPGGAVLAGMGSQAVTAGSGHVLSVFSNSPVMGTKTSGSTNMYVGLPSIQAQGPQ